MAAASDKSGKKVDRILYDVYYNVDSPACYAGVNAVLKEAKNRLSNVKKEDVIKFLTKQETYTLHKPIRRKFRRNKTVTAGLDVDWQADLMDMQDLAQYNDGNRYVLTVIDILSHYVWAIPTKTKKPTDTRDAFERILLESGRKPWRLMTDKGKEFVSPAFTDFVNERDIHHFTARDPKIKAGTVERMNRTIKARLWRYFTKNRTWRYVDVLPNLTDAINNSVNRTTGYRPADVTFRNETEVWNRVYKRHRSLVPEYKFDVGEKVRQVRTKKTFEKGYEPTFTTELFVIAKRFARFPPVYQLKDYAGNISNRVFYENQLVKVIKEDEIYRVEEIIRTRTKNGQKELFVKWDGYDDSYNSWIPATDMVTT